MGGDMIDAFAIFEERAVRFGWSARDKVRILCDYINQLCNAEDFKEWMDAYCEEPEEPR